MRNIIYEVLNCDDVIEKCCKLDATHKNWKLILFDTDVDNLALIGYNKKFGKYTICGLGDYNHCFVMDRKMLVKQNNVPVCFSTCINFDSNVSSYISSMFFKERVDKELVNMILYIRKQKFQTTCQHYAFEASLNQYPINEAAVYNTLYADKMLTEMTEKQIEDGDFVPFVLPENAYQDLYRAVQYIKNDKGQEYEIFWIIYAMLLKGFIIRVEVKKGNKGKISELLEFIRDYIGVYLENESYLIGKYICRDSYNKDFFRHMQPNRDKEAFLRDVKGMAWDLCHLRNVLEEMKVRNIADNIVFLHCFASYEIGLIDVLKSNQIKRILYLEDEAYYKYEHEIFDIDGCAELKEVYADSFTYMVKNSALKEVCLELEEQVKIFLKS